MQIKGLHTNMYRLYRYSRTHLELFAIKCYLNALD